MILQKILPDYYNSRANKTFVAPFGIDDPEKCLNTKTEWQNYFLKDFTYEFNSWGFRGNDYSQYKNQPVNICLGDSFTLNIGGPIEHSWPSQLSKYFDIPTLNFGVDGAGNDLIYLLYQYLLDCFDVQNTFVMYSFFHRRYDNINKQSTVDVYNHEENIEYFNRYKLENVYYTFLPPWCWSDSEKDYLQKYHAKAYEIYEENFDDDIINKVRVFTTRDRYNFFKGVDWPKYDDFVNGATLLDHVHHEIFVSKLKYDLFLLTNRDGFHLNYLGNKMVCDYFKSIAH